MGLIRLLLALAVLLSRFPQRAFILMMMLAGGRSTIGASAGLSAP